MPILAVQEAGFAVEIPVPKLENVLEFAGQVMLASPESTPHPQLTDTQEKQAQKTKTFREYHCGTNALSSRKFQFRVAVLAPRPF